MVGNPEGFDGNKTDLDLVADSEEPTVRPVAPAEELRLKRIAQLASKSTAEASLEDQRSYRELVAKVEAGDEEPLRPLTPQERQRLAELDHEQGKSTGWNEDMAEEQKALRKRYLQAGVKDVGSMLN